MVKRKASQADGLRMGYRIRNRLDELGWTQTDLLNKIPDLGKGTLSAMILNNRIASEWSDEIAEALDVEHRWLQKGVGEKMRRGWPFTRFSRRDFDDLPKEEQTLIEGYIDGKIQEHRKAGPKRAA